LGTGMGVGIGVACLSCVAGKLRFAMGFLQARMPTTMPISKSNFVFTE